MIGVGGAGKVWEGRHHLTALRVAIKEVEAQEDVQSQLLSEVRAVAALDHPNVVRVYDYGASDTGAWMAMELLRGGSLNKERGRMDWPTLQDVLLQTLEALAHAHARGIVHRDLKPGNLLRDHGSRIALADFGIAATLDGHWGEGRAVGTIAYMAPEQVLGERWRQGPWTDLYGLACLAWSLVTGQGPFGTKPREKVARAHLSGALPTLPGEWPAGFDAWLHRLLEKDPKNRFQSANEAAAALRKLGGSRVVAKTWRDVGKTKLSQSGEGLIGLRPLPWVGRDRERERLWKLLADVAREERASIVVLTGSEGIGKTRLASWLRHRAVEEGQGGGVMVTHSDQPGLEDGVAGLVQGSVHGSGTTDAVLAERLKAVFGEDADDLLAVARPGTGMALAPSHRLALVGRLLARRSLNRPFVLHLDDAHLDDEALQLAAWLQGKPLSVLVVLTIGRAELTTARRQALTLLLESGAQEIRLRPLTPAQVKNLLQRLLALEPGLSARIQQASAGNPRVANELVHGLLRSGALEGSAAGFCLRARAEVRVLPSVAAVWSRRLAAMVDHRPESDRWALELAAVLGSPFLIPEWQAACVQVGLSGSRMWLQLLAMHGLVELDGHGIAGDLLPGGDFARFTHAGVRRALIEGATERLRDWHSVCANVTRNEPARWAYHLAEAGWPDRAREPLLQAIAERMHTADYDRAELLLQRHEALAEELSIPADDPRLGRYWVLRARLSCVLNDHRAISLARQAVATATDKADRIESRLWLGRSLTKRERRGRASSALDEAHQVLHEALSLVGPDVENRLVAYLNRVIGTLHITRGELALAETFTLKAMAMFETDRNRAMCAQDLCYVRQVELDWSGAMRWLKVASRLVKGDRRQRVSIQTSLGLLHWKLGEPEKAHESLDLAQGIAERLGYKANAALSIKAWVYLDQRDFGSALEFAEQVLYRARTGRSDQVWTAPSFIESITLGVAAAAALGCGETQRCTHYLRVLERFQSYPDDDMSAVLYRLQEDLAADDPRAAELAGNLAVRWEAP